MYQWECSAEAVTAELVRQFFNLFDASNSDGNKTICNFYGSTEMSDVTFTAFTSLAQLEELLDENSKVPIGDFQNSSDKDTWYEVLVCDRNQVSIS